MTSDPQPASQDESSSAAPQAGAADSEPANPSVPTPSTLTHRPRTEAEFKSILLEQYVHRDFIQSAAMIDELNKLSDLNKGKRREIEGYKEIRQKKDEYTPSKLYGEGWTGFGNGFTDEDEKRTQTRILYPAEKRRRKPRRTQLRIKRKDLALQAEQVEELVPIRLDVDWEKVKLRDTFTWNLHDRTIPPQLFAEQLVQDLGLTPPLAEPVVQQVQQQFQEQIIDFYPPVYIPEEPLDPELPYSAYKNDEMRILIKLNITIGPYNLVDKFEWEINNPLNSPEEFAQSMARDLSLSGEFTTAIAHCIREQTQLFIRSLYIIGHPFDGRPVEDADLVAAFLPSPLPSVLRPQQQAKEFAPQVYDVKEAELDQYDKAFSREQRRQKRSVNRRGGPMLPDLKDRQRTVRTMVVSSVLPGAAESIDKSRLFKSVGGTSGRGRRGVTRQDGADLSESDDDEDSAPDSPAIQLAGTARTRNMRGAATAAQQRMAVIGRSETPEATTAHHHETRISQRRFGRDAREDSADTTSYIIKLKMPKEKFRKLVRELKSGRPSHQQTPSITRAQSITGTPAPSGSMGPPSTPAPNPIPTSASGGQIGRVDAPPPVPGQPPPQAPHPPVWLSAGLSNLVKQYPNDRFEGMMRYSAVSTTTELPVTVPPGAVPEGVKWMFLPRIRCHDCPGKLYTPGPDTTVGNFEVHLKNKGHREKVNARVANTTGAAAAAS
ncbi:snf5 smarcb1 ini1 protein [Rutstroemia sp. NJR-2017a WRK4]|nr:snf5 smarcb1 ini1 protein [Rutstroemia sp. NJR-2017a WRK4]